MPYPNGATKNLTAQLRLKNGVASRTLSAGFTCDATTETIGLWDANGANRTIVLGKEEESNGLFHFVKNTAAGAYNLVLNDDAGSTIVTVNQNEWAIVACDGTSWYTLPLSAFADYLATANTWALLQTLTTGALIQDAGTLGFGTPGTDVVFTADGADVDVTGTGKLDFRDDVAHFVDPVAPTKRVRIDAGTVTAGQTRVLAMPDENVTISAAGAALIDDASADAQLTTLGVSAAAKTILDDASVGAIATTLGLGTGDSPSFTGATFGGTVNFSGGSLIQKRGAGTGTGDLVEITGPDATHGWATYVYEATLAPAAIETALFTVPAESVIVATQANIATALTGGGTTVTASIGITGDVDAYGTFGAPTDVLTQNGKLNYAGAGNAPGPGAVLGVFSKAAVALKLIGAATGGTAAGDTALTAGTVKVRVVYKTLLPMVNA